MGLFIIIFVVLVYQWNKKEKALRAAEQQWADDNDPIKVAEWCEAVLRESDPNWRQHAQEDEAARERDTAAYLAAARAAAPEAAAAEAAADAAWLRARERDAAAGVR